MTNSSSIKPREARLVAVQDDDGFHLCTRYIKEYSAEGHAIFEDDGRILMSYGLYDIAIQDLENCLQFAHAMREQKMKEVQAQQETEDKAHVPAP
jgi:hypothetical protein